MVIKVWFYKGDIMDKVFITIKKVMEEPNENRHWNYPLEEIDFIFSQIEDGDRENGCEFYLYNDRLYEVEETEVILWD